MRKVLAVSLPLLLASALSASAQSTASGNATVQAAVSLQPLSIAVAGVTDFGSVSAGDIVNQTGTAIVGANVPGAGQSNALYSISGEPNTQVAISCSQNTTLILSTDPTKHLVFWPSIVHSTDAANQAGAPLGCSPFHGLPGFASILSATGTLHVWLGGFLHVGSNSPPSAGAYSGTYTITVSY